MIDIKSVQQYVDAVRSRDAISKLPAGLREHAQQFEHVILDDICAQAGITMDEQELLDLASGISEKAVQTVLSTAVNFIVAALKKYYPTLTWSAVSGLVGHFIK